MRKLALLFLALGSASGVNAEPEPIISFKIRHYLVKGAGTTEIAQSVYENTPVQMEGGRYGAVTQNQITTSYSAVATGQGGCEVKNARIQLDSTIVLPKLEEDNHSPSVLLEWARYSGALRAHEMQHANNGKYIAETLAGRLYNFKSTLPCHEMRARLDLAVDRLIKNMAVWDKQMDAKTQHGRSQGAFLRPGIR